MTANGSRRKRASTCHCAAGGRSLLRSSASSTLQRYRRMPVTRGTVRDSARLSAKTRLFTALVVVSNVSGNSALTHGMKQLGDIGNSPLALIGALFHPWVALGVALLILWTLTHMALLSWADLSYVLPVTAIGYILTALSGRFV